MRAHNQEKGLCFSYPLQEAEVTDPATSLPQDTVVIFEGAADLSPYPVLDHGPQA